MTARLRKWLRVWAPALLYLGLITALSHVRLGRLSFRTFTYADKVVHAFIYGVLCFLLFRILRQSRRRWLLRWSPLVALVMASAYGVFDEWHQSFVGRDCDPADWLADTIGAAVMAAALMVYVEIHDHPADDSERY